MFGQTQEEGGPIAWMALGPHLTAMPLNNALDVEQPQAHALVLPGVMQPLKSAEQTGGVARIEAYAVVVALILLGLVPLSAGLVVLSVPLLLRLWRGIASAREPRLLDPVVKKTAGLHLVFGLLYCAGVLLGG